MLYTRNYATARLLRTVDMLELEHEIGTPRRYLDVLIELCDVLVPHTGPETLQTRHLKSRLAAVKASIEARPSLRVTGA